MSHRPQITTYVYKGTPIRLYSVGWLLLFCGITKRSLINYEKQGFPKPIVKTNPINRTYLAAEIVQYANFFRSGKATYGHKGYARYVITECRNWRKQFAAKFAELTPEKLKVLKARLNILQIENDDEILRQLNEEEIKKTEKAFMKLLDADIK